MSSEVDGSLSNESQSSLSNLSLESIEDSVSDSLGDKRPAKINLTTAKIKEKGNTRC